MSDPKKLLGETVRVWDAQHSGVFVEGEVVALSLGTVIFVRTACECGKEKIVGHATSLPIEVLTWMPA